MLGRGIASAVALLDVTAVVVGGGFAPPSCSSTRCTPRTPGTPGLPHVRAAAVLPAALGPETGLLCAAALVLAGDRYRTGD